MYLKTKSIVSTVKLIILTKIGSSSWTEDVEVELTAVTLGQWMFMFVGMVGTDTDTTVTLVCLDGHGPRTRKVP